MPKVVLITVWSLVPRYCLAADAESEAWVQLGTPAGSCFSHSIKKKYQNLTATALCCFLDHNNSSSRSFKHSPSSSLERHCSNAQPCGGRAARRMPKSMPPGLPYTIVIYIGLIASLWYQLELINWVVASLSLAWYVVYRFSSARNEPNAHCSESRY